MEKVICKDDEFARWDLILAKTYVQKKNDGAFKKEYQSWLKERDSCNNQTALGNCLREQYARIFGAIYEKHDGPAEPLLPDAECFLPMVRGMNGDEGFYAVRVISRYLNCGKLNINLQKVDTGAKYEVSFVGKRGPTYYYLLKETYEKEFYQHEIGVQFAVKEIIHKYPPGKSFTLVMSLIEH
ncbi:hypothetical protein [Oligoflexus tunisiensis]|uniref:hypothetical protein n=1 Tax=Oligoflexus tunisiensis TaxID=708132 RepID=UPI00114CD9DB|nr:hypothetical protein [Oligoflexus tunisiensis]